MNKLLCYMALILLLVGCIHKPFQPVPDEWELWRKSKVVIQNDIERAMLECGHPMGVGALPSREEVGRNFRKQWGQVLHSCISPC